MFPSDRAGFTGGASLIQPELTGKVFLCLLAENRMIGTGIKERHYGTKPFVPAGQNYLNES